MNTMKLSKHNLTALCALSAAILCGAARAEEPVGAEEKAGWSYEPGAGISFNEQSIVTAEFTAAFDSKYLSYGLVDHNDPIITPSASITFFDWISIYVDNIRDMNYRADRIDEVHPEIDLVHTFGDFDVYVGYQWEMIRGDNSQFIVAEVTYTGFWLEPTLYFEKDMQRDHGTYLNLEIGHDFAIIDGESEEDDPVLVFRPSFGQGWGDRRRVAGYLAWHNREDEEGECEPLERNALMDTSLKGALTWNITDYLSLGGYVMYSDYVFDRKAREAARDYNEDYRFSYNFTCGLALTASF